MPHLDFDSGRSTLNPRGKHDTDWLASILGVLFVCAIVSGVACLAYCGSEKADELAAASSAKSRAYSANAKIACPKFCIAHDGLFAINNNKADSYAGRWALTCVCNDGVTIDAPNRF
jgi:hypothetical protein